MLYGMFELSTVLDLMFCLRLNPARVTSLTVSDDAPVFLMNTLTTWPVLRLMLQGPGYCRSCQRQLSSSKYLSG